MSVFVVEFLKANSSDRLSMSVEEGTTLGRAIEMLPSSERAKLYTADGSKLITEFRYVTGSQTPVKVEDVIVRNPTGRPTMFIMTVKTKGNEE